MVVVTFFVVVVVRVVGSLVVVLRVVVGLGVVTAGAPPSQQISPPSSSPRALHAAQPACNLHPLQPTESLGQKSSVSRGVCLLGDGRTTNMLTLQNRTLRLGRQSRCHTSYADDQSPASSKSPTTTDRRRVRWCCRECSSCGRQSSSSCSLQTQANANKRCLWVSCTAGDSRIGTKLT